MYGFLCRMARCRLPCTLLTGLTFYRARQKASRRVCESRIAYARVERSLASPIRFAPPSGSRPPLMAELVTKWIQDGTAKRMIAHKQAEVKARHELANSILGPSDAMSPHRWILLPDHWRAEDFSGDCRARGIVISTAASFAINRDDVPIAVRVCLASAPHRRQLEPALRTIAELLRTGPSTHFRCNPSRIIRPCSPFARQPSKTLPSCLRCCEIHRQNRASRTSSSCPSRICERTASERSRAFLRCLLSGMRHRRASRCTTSTTRHGAAARACISRTCTSARDSGRSAIARALLEQLARIAMQEGCGRLQWVVHNENSGALRLYESVGARVFESGVL